jgi:hypothetical protein
MTSFFMSRSFHPGIVTLHPLAEAVDPLEVRAPLC